MNNFNVNDRVILVNSLDKTLIGQIGKVVAVFNTKTDPIIKVLLPDNSVHYLTESDIKSA